MSNMSKRELAEYSDWLRRNYRDEAWFERELETEEGQAWLAETLEMIAKGQPK